MDTNLVLDYIRATSNLYGIVPLEKVVEIYNQQNEETIVIDDLEQFKEIEGEYFEYFSRCFVHEAILIDDSFDYIRAKQADKPYYIPSKVKLLKFADESYTEKTKEYKALCAYIQKNIVHDPVKADELTDDIQLVCAMDFSVESVMYEFERRGISFKSESQVMELMPLVMELSNNTRIWDNRGHTPSEIFEKFEKPNLKPLPNGEFPGIGDRPNLGVIPGGANKIGRNDPCPCGSGKKYKKCCLGKEEKGN